MEKGVVVSFKMSGNEDRYSEKFRNMVQKGVLGVVLNYSTLFDSYRVELLNNKRTHMYIGSKNLEPYPRCVYRERG